MSAFLPPVVKAAKAFVAVDELARLKNDPRLWSEWTGARKLLLLALLEYEAGQHGEEPASVSFEHLCESPIEKALYSALGAHLPELAAYLGEADFADPRVREHYHWRDGIWIFPQLYFPELGARVDFFAMVNWGGLTDGVVIECDGHDFHERTKEQAAGDRSRDRAFAKANITVLRFTGSEIFKDAEACARDAARIIADRAVGFLGGRKVEAAE